MSRRSAYIILGVMVVVLFSGALDYGLDMLFYPWARANPPLLDHWVGELTTGNGVRLGVALDMHRAYTDDGTICTRCNQIEGTATTCDARGTILRYRISGSPTDRQGRTLHIGARPETSSPPDGLELDGLRGTWDGSDTLSLEAGFFWRRGTSAISSTDDPANKPVPLRMARQRPSAFESVCGALR